MKKIFIILLSALICISTAAYAEDFEIDRKFTVAMGIDLSSSEIDLSDDRQSADVDIDEYGANLSVGYFIIDMIEVGSGLSLNKKKTKYSFNDDSTKSEFLYLDMFGAFHFPTGTRFDPYIKAFIGCAQLDLDGEDDTSFAYGLSLGVNYFLFKNVSINPSINYRAASFDLRGVDVDADSLDFNMGFGIHF